MSDNKKYRLLKDYPGIKSGEIIEPNTYGIPVTSDQIKTSTWPLFYSVDGSILNAWVPCTALNNKEWFEEITPEQSKLQSQDKPQPSSIDRIEVKDNKVIISHLSAHDNFKGHDTAHWYQFCSNKPLYSYPNSKIISAIEQAINGKEENNEELVGLLRDAVSSTWGNTSLEQTQILFDKFLHDRKLAKPTQGLINAFLTDAVNRNIYDKKYSQSEVDTIREETFHDGYFKGWYNGCFEDDKTLSAKIIKKVFQEYIQKSSKPSTPTPTTSKEQGWEILTWFSRDGEVAVLVGGDIEGNLKAGYTIRSVRRNSDGEVFTVGDKVEHDEQEEGQISKFIVNDVGTLLTYFERYNVNLGWDYISKFKKLPTQPSSTEDKGKVLPDWMPDFCHKMVKDAFAKEIMEAESKAFYAAREYSDGKWSNQFPPPKLGEAKHPTFSDYKEAQKLKQ